MADYERPPGIDMGKYVFEEPALPGPRREPMPAPPVVPAVPEAQSDSPWIVQMLKGVLPMGPDWLFGATPKGETDLRHDADPQTRERAERQADDEAAAKRSGFEMPDIFKGLF